MCSDERGEDLLRNLAAVVGRPTSDDGLSPVITASPFASVEGLDYRGEPAANASHGILARLDQQSAVRLTEDRPAEPGPSREASAASASPIRAGSIIVIRLRRTGPDRTGPGRRRDNRPIHHAGK